MAAVGAIVGGVTTMIQSSYQAKVAEMNAEVAEENAKRATERGGIEAFNNDIQTRALLGEQESAQAASGVSLSGKSQILTRQSARKLGRIDTLNIVQGADVERYDYQTQAANFKAEAKSHKITGTGALIGSFVEAASAIAGGASGMPSMVGKSSSVATPYKYIPQPLAKPVLLPAHVPAPMVNPLLKGRKYRGSY